MQLPAFILLEYLKVTGADQVRGRPEIWPISSIVYSVWCASVNNSLIPIFKMKSETNKLVSWISTQTSQRERSTILTVTLSLWNAPCSRPQHLSVETQDDFQPVERNWWELRKTGSSPLACFALKADASFTFHFKNCLSNFIFKRQHIMYIVYHPRNLPSF